MQKTRRQILDILKREGTATLEALARGIGLSPVTIRAHLSVLERNNLILADEVRGRVGRPHFVYSLTDGAESHFPAVYDAVAHRFLEAIKAIAEPDQMDRLLTQVAERWAAEKAGRLIGKGLEERVVEVVRIRTEEGAMAEWERLEGGYVIRQHHCAASRLSHLHPEVCLAELEYIRRMLGVSVHRESWARNGDRQCVYRVAIQ